MTNAIEITLLLERVRDVYLGAEDKDALLLGPDSTLSPHVASDIDITFRVRLIAAYVRPCIARSWSMYCRRCKFYTRGGN